MPEIVLKLIALVLEGHKFTSHEADAFKMLAIGMGKLGNQGLSTEEWRSLRQQPII